MRQLVAVPLDDGPAVLVEVDASADEIVRSARPGEVAAALDETFQAALARLQPMTQAIVGKLREIAERPDVISVEFGIKLSADAGLVVAHTSGEANFRVNLRWRRP